MGDWKKNLRVVDPYVPGEQPKQENMIKLNTNENPYPPAPGVEKVLKSMETGDFRLYPKPDARELVDALAEEYGVPANQVFVGVGSDDVLGMAFLTCFNSEKPILFPDITYSFYPVWADLFKIPYKRPALDENFCIRKEDYFAENGGIVIANPNAPTSIAMPLADIEEIVKKNPDSVVIIDEAYVDFGGESALPLVDKYENLLVVQTFSKSRSMAGMRIGFAIGCKELIDAMYAVRNSYNSYTMNMPSILCGVEAVKDRAYFDKTRNAIMETRADVAEKLAKLGFTVLPSGTNFLFAAHESVPAEELFAMLREKHIYVRYFKSPRINNYLRITIGTPEQMEVFLKEVEAYLATK
ncbi:MAG: histidinol-phosphate transaminase [Lachnospiraceae bacterium]|nr:histidinol-phosphate transaminase [Lachnospiraceae bacterium]